MSLFVNTNERFEALLGQIGNIGYVTLGSFGYSRAEAEQEAMIAAWECARRGKEIEFPRAYIQRMLRNNETDKHRREKTRAEKHEAFVAETDYTTDGNAIETEQQFRARLTRLKPDRADLVVDAHYYGLSTIELAEKHSLPMGTVKSRLNRAIDKLRTSREV